MTCSSADDCFLVVTPLRCTSGGSWASTWLTRLVTLTVLRSGSEPTCEADGERVAAVAARRRLHVDHPLDAVDLASMTWATLSSTACAEAPG